MYAARTKFGIPKLGDLLLLLLHHKVVVGTNLDWIPVPQQEHPVRSMELASQLPTYGKIALY